jgi:hypothetical protein
LDRHRVTYISGATRIAESRRLNPGRANPDTYIGCEDSMSDSAT